MLLANHQIFSSRKTVLLRGLSKHFFDLNIRFGKIGLEAHWQSLDCEVFPEKESTQNERFIELVIDLHPREDRLSFMLLALSVKLLR